MRASSFGSCVKAQVAERLGLVAQEPPAVLAAAFERGNVHEEECAAALRADGWMIGSEQQEVECEGIPGHLDGIIWRLDDVLQRVWEAKAPTAWAAYERAHKTGKHTPLTLRYAWQSSLYMHGTGLEQMVSCLDDGRVKSFIIEVPPFTLEQIRERKALIEAMSSVPAECEPECFDAWSCPYRYLHDKPTVVENPEVDRWVEDYYLLGESIKKAKREQDQAKAELEKLMVFDDRIETQTSIVTKVTRENPAKPDLDAMRADGIDVDKYMTPGTVSSFIKPTRKKGLDSVPGEA